MLATQRLNNAVQSDISDGIYKYVIQSDGTGGYKVTNTAPRLIWELDSNLTTALRTKDIDMWATGEGPDGNLYVSDYTYKNVYVFNTQGKYQRLLGDPSNVRRLSSAPQRESRRVCFFLCVLREDNPHADNVTFPLCCV